MAGSRKNPTKQTAAKTSDQSTAAPSDQDTGSRASTIALVVFVGVVLAGAGLTGWQAYDSDDFWNVAVPGISTGAGTLILAAVTFWLSGRQKRVDEAARADADFQYSLREARKVVPSYRSEQGQPTIVGITNAGRESIVEVHLQRAWADGKDVWDATSDAVWEWQPTDVVSWISGGRTAGWYRRFIAPGATEEFAGTLARTAGSRQGAKADSSARDKVQIEVAWTDATGRHWLKHDWREPKQLSEPAAPRPTVGLEDIDSDETQSDPA